MFFHFFPFPTVRSLLQRESPDSSLPRSFSMLFCSFFKKSWSFKAAVPKFSSFFAQTELISAPQSPSGLLFQHPLSRSGSSSISPSVPTGSEAAAAIWEAATKVRKPAGCFSPRKILGRNQHLYISYLEWALKRYNIPGWTDCWQSSGGEQKNRAQNKPTKKKTHSLQLMKLIYMYFLYNYG